ncbi:cysteine-rich repeat secretory protein 58-like [Argentina anserina]|uniref:cysteine-rich repeat secretory protein 58-like n=1 Tax=Argentina anserina TaxID=57926 RepID=UPI0021761DEF|nr:cysteine-rich repeat secretory protein 58-like [Potentilla anserina]
MNVFLHYSQITLLLIIFLSIISLFKFVSCDSKTQTYPLHYIHHYCSDQYVHAKNKGFHDNVNFLLSDLTSKSSKSSFYNSTAGDKNDEKVNGLFLCRGDVDSQVCHNCIDNAAKTLRDNCTDSLDTTVYYEECMLRYSNRSIFATEQELPFRYWCSVNMVSDKVADQFNQSVSKLMGWLVDKAAFGNTTPMYFSTGEENTKTGGSGTSWLHGLMQCTPDINQTDCQKCLKAATGSYQEVCAGRMWAMIFAPSCQLRYTISAFMKSERPPKSAGDGRREKYRPYVAVVAVMLLSTMFVVRA